MQNNFSSVKKQLFYIDIKGEKQKGLSSSFSTSSCRKIPVYTLPCTFSGIMGKD